MSNASNLSFSVNPTLNEMVAYRVARHGAPIDLKLDGNEGAAPPNSLLQALAEGDGELLRRYPDASALENKLARTFALSAQQVIATAGADDGIDRACRALLGPNRELILPEPTFEMIRRYATLSGASINSISWPSGSYPVDEVIAAVNPRTAAIAVVSPNNPTGATVSVEDLKRLSAAAPQAVLLVDQAYAEFADQDLSEAALRLPNAIVFRTLSKAWGLAGLRVGYALGPGALIDCLRAAGHPYGLSAPSIALATQRLQTNDDDVRAYIAEVKTEREFLRQQLDARGAPTLPSQANFVLTRPQQRAWLCDGLAGLGIAIRSWPHDKQLRDFARISCPGNPQDFRRLQRSIDCVLAPQALLFDMDGVLADVRHSYRETIMQTAASFGVALTHADIDAAKRTLNSNNDWLLTQNMMRQRGHEASLSNITERFELLYQGTERREGLRSRETLLCSRSLLARLANRLPLGVVTGRPRRDAERFLDEHGLRALFDCVICMEDAPEKPDPAPVRLALDQIGVERAWMVGDTINDIAAARSAGVVPLGLSNKKDDAAALTRAGAARVFSRLEELEEIQL